MPRLKRPALSLVVLVAALVPSVSAQVLGRTDDRQLAGGQGYYVNALPGEPTVRVSVEGDVPRTGVYDLGRGFDLQSLVVMAGEPDVRELEPRDPTLTVSLFRTSGTSRDLAFSAPYEDVVQGRSGALALADGDVVGITMSFGRGVYVWGAVREPGYFEVGPGVDAVRLLALAGGPVGDGVRDDRQTAETTVTILRPGQGTVYESTLETFVTGAGVPDLAAGDAVQVEVVRRNRFTFRDGLSIVGSVAAVLLVAIQVIVTIDNASGN